MDQKLIKGQSVKRKNILLIFADQWRDDQLGSPVSHTPNLDALSQEALRFTRHYTQAIPCAPARASAFTGLHAQTHGVVANRIPLNSRHKTLAQYLRRFGYSPTLFGYTDTALDPRQFEPGDPQRSAPYQVLPGCEVGCHQPTDNPSDWMAHLRAKGFEFTNPDDIYSPDFSRPNATGGAAGYPTRYAAQDSDTAYLTDRILSWQSVQPQGWCAMLCYLRPHPPTIAPEPWNRAVDPMQLPPPVRHGTANAEAALHPYMADQLASGKADEKCSPGLSGRVADVAENDWRSIRAIHLALMAELDAHLGRIFAQLKASNQWDDTLILFSSDHGEMMFDHYLCNQAAWFDQCAHIPFLLRLPEKSAQNGKQVDEFSGSIDLLPTLLDYLGAEVPNYLDGRSLLPFFHGQIPAQWRDAIQWEFHFRDRANNADALRKPADCMMSVFRDQKFKHVYMPGLPSVLIDLEKDPLEMGNLAGHKDYRETERDYLARQLRHQIRYRDRILAPS